MVFDSPTLISNVIVGQNVMQARLIFDYTENQTKWKKTPFLRKLEEQCRGRVVQSIWNAKNCSNNQFISRVIKFWIQSKKN